MLTVQSLWGFQQKIFSQTFMSLHWTPANAVKVHIAVTEPRLILYSQVIAFYCCSGDLQCVCLFRDTKSRTAEMEHNPGALKVNFICFVVSLIVSDLKKIITLNIQIPYFRHFHSQFAQTHLNPRDAARFRSFLSAKGKISRGKEFRCLRGLQTTSELWKCDPFSLSPSGAAWPREDRRSACFLWSYSALTHAHFTWGAMDFFFFL